MLKKEVDKILKKENSNLFESKRSRLWHYINRWYFIVLFILAVFFCLQFINISFLNFIHIDSNSVKQLIDGRTTNVVTMISVTFAIIGFLIANLAIKESFTYNLLFKKSNFFPVSFFALTLIAAFIILSTLKETLPINYQIRTLLTGTYLILIAVFLIGYLFTRLVKFTNQKYLLELVREELIKESKYNLLLIGRKKISTNKIAELKLATYNQFYFSPKSKGDFQIPKGQTIISDIKFQKLKKLVKQIDINDFFVKDVCIYRELTQTDEDGFFFVEENKLEQNSKILKELNECIITSTQYVSLKNEAEEYIIQKINENIKVNNDKLVEEYLEILLEKHKLEQSVKFDILNVFGDITYTIGTNTIKMIEKTIFSNSLESFYAINKFCGKLLNLFIVNKKELYYFKGYLDIAVYYYTISYNYYKRDKAKYGKTYEQCSDRAARRIESVFFLLSYNFDKADLKEKEYYNKLKCLAFTAFSKLLFEQVRIKDIEHFKFTLNQLEITLNYNFGKYSRYDFANIIQSEHYTEEEKYEYKLKIEEYNYFKHTVLGIKYWLYYLYENNQISLDELSEFVELISTIIREQYIEFEFWEIELLYNTLNSNAFGEYLNWFNWDYRHHEDGKAYTMPNVFDWIFTGVIIDTIKQGNFYNYYNIDVNLIEKQNLQNKTLLIDTLKKSLDKVNSNNNWQTYFDTLKEPFNKVNNIQNIQNQLNQIGANFEIQKAKKIVIANLEPEKVQNFRENFYNGWKKSEYIRRVFEYYNNKVKDKNTSPIGLRIFLEKGKSFFLKDDVVLGVVSIANHNGRKVSIREETLFLETVLRYKTEKIYSSIEIGLDKAIAELRNSETQPTVILLGEIQMSLYENEKWSNEKKIDFSNGTYDGIPVFYIRSVMLGNRFIVADFQKAFTMLYSEIEDAFDNLLEINIEEISDEMAKEKLQNEREKWTNINGQTLSDEDALNYIKTSVLVSYKVFASFEINNSDAFENGLIKKDIL